MITARVKIGRVNVGEENSRKDESDGNGEGSEREGERGKKWERE